MSGNPSESQASASRNRGFSDATAGHPRDPEAFSPPRRAATETLGEADDASLRRRSRASRRAIPSLAPRTTLAQRTAGQFTLGGPDETSRLRVAHEPFVHPGYSDLNPSYDQPTNAKPVWSLAKPLPRVVRPGMVPTKNELLENRMNAEMPTENSQKLGLNVDPNEIEQGRIAKSLDVRKMAAQVADARIQRENNFIKTVLAQDAGVASARLSRISSRRSQEAPLDRRPSAPPPHLSTVQEGEPYGSSSSDQEKDDDHLRPPPVASGVDVHLGHDELLEGNHSVETLHLDEAVYPEDLHPLVQNMVEDEIHNNHTSWSVIRTHHREALAESLAVFVQLTLGFCSDISVTVAKAGNPNTTDWAWGFATMIGIYISGGVSGAHLNPSITTMLWFYRGFPMRKMPEYFLAQFIGAFCACLAAYGIYYLSIQHFLDTDSAQDIVNSFVTSQRSPFVNPATALFNELIGTMCLTVVVLALGDDQNAPPGAGMNSLIIGLVITCLSMAFANQTGAALNPSRDFGPRLALLALGYGSKLFTNPYWFYGPWAGSLLGAFLGAFLYDFMIFTGGESPVNYPLARTQRSFYKSKLKWRRRLHLAPDEAQEKIA